MANSSGNEVAIAVRVSPRMVVEMPVAVEILLMESTTRTLPPIIPAIRSIPTNRTLGPIFSFVCDLNLFISSCVLPLIPSLYSTKLTSTASAMRNNPDIVFAVPEN